MGALMAGGGSIDQFKIFEAKISNFILNPMYEHGRFWARCAITADQLVAVICVEMQVAEGVDKPCACNPHILAIIVECIGGDIKRNTQKEVGTSLIKLATKFTVGNIELNNAWHEVP